MIKSLTQRILNVAGYELRRKFGAVVDWPVELSTAEREIVSYVLSERLTMASFERLITTVMACKHALEAGIEGDFVECGVWRGGNAIAAAEIFKLHGSDKAVWLFDTFQGMTAPTDADVQVSDGKAASSREIVDILKDCVVSIESVRRNFEMRGLTTNVEFVQGDVCESLDYVKLPSKICVLRLDTDWYESTKKELEVLYPRVPLGGCLIVDDYGHWAGSKKATDEYFARSGGRPFFHYTDYTGRVGVKVR